MATDSTPPWQIERSSDPPRAPVAGRPEGLPEGPLGGALPPPLAASAREGRCRHTEFIAAREARVSAWPGWLHPALLAALTGAGLTAPWSHQRAAMDAAHAGEHVVLATGTASGKSLSYVAPALSSVLDGLDSPTGRGATVLYLSPTKALAEDQRTRLESWALPGVRIATYDGDTAPDERRWIRDHAHVVLSNPDLLHHSLLPGHDRWRPFLRTLRYVVVDECHTYRGVLGSHVAAVVRRLRRVLAHSGAFPTFVLASATVSAPEEHASRLIGLPVRAVTEDGSPRGGLSFVLWEPPTIDGHRRSATTEAADLLADLVADDVQTVAFARSRAGVEALASRARDRLGECAPELADRVAAYRGGYLPEDRRGLERDLRDRLLLGVAATNALELGVDIAGLDAVLVAGWPGRRASLWQQAGRAGRSAQDATAVFIAADDPLDTYLLSHPEAIFGAPVETTVLDPHNPHVLAPHLAAAAAELPLREDDLSLFGPSTRSLVATLVAQGFLRRRPSGWYWAREDRPTEHVSLRGAAATVSIVDRRSGRVLGTIDEATAHSQVHAGAVHVHQGQTHVVTDLDLAAGVASVVRGDPGWSTFAQDTSSFDLESEDRGSDHGGVRVCFGSVRVRRQVTGFLRRLPNGQVLGQHSLDLPERHLVTKGVWWTVAPEALLALGLEEERWPGALHAAEHAAIGMLPLVASSDRWDVGGVSTALHPSTGLPTVLVYDGYPGGAGFAAQGHAAVATWLGATIEAILGCRCADGCPSCIQSPKCGNGNNPLDKAGACVILDHVVAAIGQTAQQSGPRGATSSNAAPNFAMATSVTSTLPRRTDSVA